MKLLKKDIGVDETFSPKNYKFNVQVLFNESIESIKENKKSQRIIANKNPLTCLSTVVVSTQKNRY